MQQKVLTKMGKKFMFDEQPEVVMLNNGLRIIYKEVLGTQTTQCGFVINTGARDDGEFPGLAHCFEHMLFKGTTKRNATQVLKRLEVVGGELNAFTGKDLTTVYAHVLSIHFKRATELLADIVRNSSFKEKELIREKKVIREEINLYLDTPEENIFDEFQKLQYPNHPMGYNILGDEESLQAIDTVALKEFWKKYYHPRNMAFVVMSNIPLKQVIRTCKFMESWESEDFVKADRREPNKDISFNKVVETEFNQVYACLGIECFPNNHPKKEAMMLLNNILGGPGMNSRLNLAVREKHGLTYQIDSSYTAYDDCGLFYITFSTEEKQLKKTLKLIERELQLLIDKPLTHYQLQQAKNQFHGQLQLAEESKTSLLVYYGKSSLKYDSIEGLDALLAKVSAVTVEDLQIIAKEILQFKTLNTLIFKPNK